MRPVPFCLISFSLWMVLLPRTTVAEEPATIVEVVANGAGLTKKTALEDAYRNAVQQVVGAYVDAETLVKNDKLLKDRILATSNGFIVDSKEISSQASNGLVRVTIRARVESRKLVAGLTAAKITVHGLDGKSLFATALTKMERKENLQETLLKILGELGPMLQVEMIGKPDFDATTSELVFQLKVQPDYEKFKLFRSRLTAFLDKVAIRKEKVLVRAAPVLGKVEVNDKLLSAQLRSQLVSELYMTETSKALMFGPVIKTNKEWVLWIQTFENSSFTMLRWTGYVLDSDWRTALQTVLRQPYGNRYTNGVFSKDRSTPYNLKFPNAEALAKGYPKFRYDTFGRFDISTSFLDADKEPLLLDKFELQSDVYLAGDGANEWVVGIRKRLKHPRDFYLSPPAMSNCLARALGDRLQSYVGYQHDMIPQYASKPKDWRYHKNATINLFLAPVMLGIAPGHGSERDELPTPCLYFRRFLRLERRLKVKPDQLELLGGYTIELNYAKPRPEVGRQ